MDLANAIMLAGLGFLAGWAGGLLGIAGSILMIPGLGMLYPAAPFHLHQAAAMIVNVFVVAPAVRRHRRADAVVPQVVRWTIPSAIAGAVLGVLLANRAVFRGTGQGWLQLLFAAFILYVIWDNLRRLRHGAGRDDPPDAPGTRHYTAAKLVFLVGLPTGGLGGLLGVGGGLVAVPAQQAFLRVPIRAAIANSAATIVWSAAVAAVVKNASLANLGSSFSQSAQIAAFLAPTALLGGWIGAGLVHRWPTRALRVALILFLSYAAVRLTAQGIHNVSADDSAARVSADAEAMPKQLLRRSPRALTRPAQKRLRSPRGWLHERVQRLPVGQTGPTRSPGAAARSTCGHYGPPPDRLARL